MIRRILFSLAALCLTGSAASADVTYNWQAGQSNYVVLPGEEVFIPIYLKETLTGGSTSQIAADDGLFSFGITLERTSGGGQILALDRNPTFDRRNAGSTTSFPANPVALWAEQDANFGNGAFPDGDGLIHLATLHFEAPPLAGEAAFSISDFNAGTGETVTYDFRELDPLIAAGGFTVTIIPEPAGLLLLAPAAALLLRRRERLRSGI